MMLDWTTLYQTSYADEMATDVPLEEFDKEYFERFYRWYYLLLLMLTSPSHLLTPDFTYLLTLWTLNFTFALTVLTLLWRIIFTYIEEYPAAGYRLDDK